MSLKLRFMLVAAVLMLGASLLAWLSFQYMAERIVEQWGRRVAEVQVQYDSARLLQPLQREIALAQQLANSQVLRSWIHHPEDPELEARAFREMESFRRNFRDGNYFVALLESGGYYHNNAANEFGEDPLRYHLRANRPADAWFYQLIEEGRDFHLNVNPDVELGVTKLWIDVLIRDEHGDILGMVGTGMNLETILEQIVDIDQQGITTVFADYNGAIQLYRDPRFIDFASLVKPEGQKRTVDLLFDLSRDGERVLDRMRSMRDNPLDNPLVYTDFVTVDGKRHLVGIAFLSSIGWFEITLLDLDEVMPVASFAPAIGLMMAFMLLSLLLFYWVLRRLLLNPMAALERAMVGLREGRQDVALPRGVGEMGRLINHYRDMASEVIRHTGELEAQVKARTEQLEELARVDVLTGLLNRRGMTQRLEEQASRATRDGECFGLVWVDIDRFKEINDTLGHAAGDEALCQVAEVLQTSLRPYDQAARWGGDEFLVLLMPCRPEDLVTIASRLREVVAERTQRSEGGITVSVGASLVRPGEALAGALQRADDALYRAKAAGRNRLVVAETE
ncbi:diguanylate cyclase [Halomonas sp. 3H]|uniref:sensor domain-containing diguanylate cyclase n=1 Tax=Halomonas sp. 3H TaxID=2952527 RepID=UPI0020B888A6|nr:diguanylate cyclase [Halomonas sp. 3H]